MSETLGRAEASVQVDLIVKPRTLSRRYRVVALALLRRQSARNRLWQVGGLVALVVLAIIIANQFLPESKAIERSNLGLDFVPFYSAGRICLDGELDTLYDFDKLEKYQADKIWPAIPDAKPILGPWWNPPHYALMMSTIARLPFDEALNAWTIFGFACVITSAWLLARHVQRITNDGPKSWMLAPLFLLASYPCIQALGHGQNTPLSLLLLTLTALAWRARRGLLAGVLCGLMVYKPQLSALVGLMLVLTLGKRPLIGMLAVGIVTILASEFAMPGMIDRFIEVTPLNLARIMGADDYLWHRHATILALTKLGAFDRSSNLVDVISFVGRAFVFGTLLVGLWQARSSQSPSRGLDRVIVLTILATPLLMPFYFDYDLLLLAVAGVMLAASMRTESISTPFDRTILIVGLTWFVFSFFNVFIAGASQINIGTLMLLSLFALVARRIVWLARVETVMGRIPLIARA